MPEFIRENFDLNEFNYSNFYKYAEICIFSVIAFFMPFFIGNPQIVVGTVVNFFLISSALKIKDYRILPLVVAPSLGVLTRGMLFGPFTVFLIYMIPFIWIGNYILVLTFRKLKLSKKLNYWPTAIVGALLKSGFLFLSAFILFKLGVIPLIFLTTMGAVQFATAISGAFVAFGYEKVKTPLKI